MRIGGDRYAHFNLLLFMRDADGKDRTAEFHNLEGIATERGVRLFCCAAVEGVEAWLLAGHLDKPPGVWSEISRDTSLKERVFSPSSNPTVTSDVPVGGGIC